MASNKKRVPLNDLSRRFASSTVLRQEISELLVAGPYLNGAYTQEFEKEFANFIGARWSLGVSSGTTALELAIKSLDLAEGSHVGLAANAGGYASIAVINSGMVPYYLDVDANGLLTLDIISQSATNFAIVIVTHLYGQAAEIENIYQFLKSSGKFLIEDCAHATGSRFGNSRLGNFSDVSAFSFYPTKNLGAAGDAGAICTSDEKIYRRVVELRQYGWQTRYFSSTPKGGNYRIDEIQCLVLLRQLEHLDRNNLVRKEIWNRYRNATISTNCRLIGSDEQSFVAHLGVIITPYREKFQTFMEKKLIDTAIHYPFPDYIQPGISKQLDLKLPQTELFCSSVVTIPLFPEMTEVEIMRVESAIGQYCELSGGHRCT